MSKRGGCLVALVIVGIALAGGAYWGKGKMETLRAQTLSRYEELDVMAAVPTDFNMAYSSFSAPNSEGTMIAGWWMMNKLADAPTVFIVHGFGMNKSHMLSRAQVFYEGGANIALIDLRARGESGGDQVDLGPANVDDINTALAELVRLGHVGDEVLIGYGFSHGSRAMIFTVAANDAFDAVIAEAPPYSLSAAMQRQYNMPFAIPLPEGDLDGAVVEIGDRPILFVFGDQDPDLTSANVETLLTGKDAARATWVEFPDTGHGVLTRDTVELYRTTMAAFMARTMD